MTARTMRAFVLVTVRCQCSPVASRSLADGLLDNRKKLFKLEGLADDMQHAKPAKRWLVVSNVGLRCDDDDRDLGRLGAELHQMKLVLAFEVGHHQIEKDKVRPVLADSIV